MVGTPVRTGVRSARRGKDLDLASIDIAARTGNADKTQIDLARDQIGQNGGRATIGNTGKRYAGLCLEQFPGDVGDVANAGMAVCQAIRPALRIGIERGNRISRNVLASNKDDSVGLDQSHDWREALQGVVPDLRRVEQLVSDMRSRRHQERISVRRSRRDGLAADDATGAGAVLDHHGRAQNFLHRRRQGTRNGVDRTTGSERHDDLDRAIRKRGFGVLRPDGEPNEGDDEC